MQHNIARSNRPPIGPCFGCIEWGHLWANCPKDNPPKYPLNLVTPKVRCVYEECNIHDIEMNRVGVQSAEFNTNDSLLDCYDSLLCDSIELTQQELGGR